MNLYWYPHNKPTCLITISVVPTGFNLGKVSKCDLFSELCPVTKKVIRNAILTYVLMYVLIQLYNNVLCRRALPRPFQIELALSWKVATAQSHKISPVFGTFGIRPPLLNVVRQLYSILYGSWDIAPMVGGYSIYNIYVYNSVTDLLIRIDFILS